jgi:hypothetical protein
VIDETPANPDNRPQHSKTRMKEYIILHEKLCVLEEFYSMDTTEVQFNLQNHYDRYEHMTENGGVVWTNILLKKKCIVWTNPANWFGIAYLKDLKPEISLPDILTNFNENFDNFKRLWNKLNFDLEPLFKNILSHKKNKKTSWGWAVPSSVEAEAS